MRPSALLLPLALFAAAACERPDPRIFVPAPPPSPSSRSLLLVAIGPAGSSVIAVDLTAPGAADRPIQLDSAEAPFWRQRQVDAFAIYYPHDLADLHLTPGPLPPFERAGGAVTRAIPDGVEMYAASTQLAAFEWAPIGSVADPLGSLRIPVTPRGEPLGSPDAIRGISAGDDFTCLVTRSGEGYCFGSNMRQALGAREPAATYVPLRLEAPPLVGIAAGTSHACAMDVGGKMYCWGSSGRGELGRPGDPLTPGPVAVPGLGDVVGVAVGRSHTCAVRATGEVDCWGDLEQGAVGVVPENITVTASILRPARVPGLGPARRVVAGDHHTCALLADGAVWCWGANDRGQLGFAIAVARAPVRVGAIDGAEDLSSGRHHTCARLRSGDLWCWGANSRGQLGDGTRLDQHLPVPSSLGPGALVAGARATCVIDGALGATCAGASGGASDLDLERGLDPLARRPWSEVSSISLGELHSCAVTRAGGALCWGWNGWGQLGRPFVLARTEAAFVPGLSGVVSLAAGGITTCAILEGGELRCFGAIGELLPGSPERQTSEPKPIGGLAPVAQVSIGYLHACVRPRDPARRVTCFGRDNAAGQLGGGAATSTSATVAEVPGTEGAVDVSAGDQSSCAVTAGGEVLCWGANTHGQLGDGTVEERFAPVRVLGLPEPARKVSVASGRSACALLASGAVRCWGANREGQLGERGTEQSSVAVPVRDLPPALDVQCGGHHACALVASRSGTATTSVICWGRNTRGQLGAGSFASPRPLTELPDAAGAIAVAAASERTCAATPRGVSCAGTNDLGESGDPSGAREVSTPVLVAGTAGASTLALGSDHGCALISGRVACWGWDGWGQLGQGQRTIDLAPGAVSVAR